MKELYRRRLERKKIYEWLEVGLCLCFIGGFLDAYTYVSRGGVFANAQTGNIILLILGLASGEGAAALRYLIPIMFFIVGVILSELLKSVRKNEAGSFWGHCCIICAEIILLVLVGCLPAGFSDMIVNALVSLVAAIQFNSFRKMEGLPFATAFCTGNLRSMTEYLHKFIFKKDKQAIRICLKYFLFIASFAAGVLGGYYMTAILAGHAVFISAGILALLILYMIANHLKEQKADACSQ